MATPRANVYHLVTNPRITNQIPFFKCRVFYYLQRGVIRLCCVFNSLADRFHAPAEDLPATDRACRRRSAVLLYLTDSVRARLLFRQRARRGLGPPSAASRRAGPSLKMGVTSKGSYGKFSSMGGGVL